MQTAKLTGYTDTHTMNPDNTDRSGVSGDLDINYWLQETQKTMTRVARQRAAAYAPRRVAERHLAFYRETVRNARGGVA